MLDSMGLADHQALLIAHSDTPCEHVHIMVNRVGDDGRVWKPFRDMVKARRPIPQIERDFGLQRTGPRDAARELDPPEPSSGAYAEARRTGQQPLADRVRERAGEAFTEATGWRDLELRLAELGYRLERAERGSGVVVTDGRRRASLSRVDRALSGPKLAQRFGETFRDYRAHTPEPPRVTPPPGQEIEQLAGGTLWEQAGSLVDRVSSTRASFTVADLERAAFYQAESVALVREAMQSQHVLELGRHAHGPVRYASREYVEVEARMFAAAGELAARANLRLDVAGVARTLERFPHFSDEQRAAVLHATTGNDLAQVVGRAGAGKTSAARAIAAAYRDQGYDVRGAALAGKAAEGLQLEAGIPSRTLASLEHAWDKGRDLLHGGTVLAIDEAGMVDARQLSRVLDQAQARGAKVVLLGDPAQLKAIGAGDAYRGLLETHPSVSLETIRRQVEPWQQQASEHLAAGRVPTALDAYDQAGRLHWTDTRAELVARYMIDRAEHPAGSQLIVAYRNADARGLNDAVRDARRAVGELAHPAVAIGGRDYAAGDRIVFLSNDHQGHQVANLDRGAQASGVKNGTLGTIEHAAPERLTVRLDDGRAVAFHPGEYKDIAHGYAVTIHKSQGATVDRTYALADPLMDR
ncbi:MAG TPA: AAA family ATPase, partial [Thermoanaerobaculia bacterium]|nr:AAA family ATPase [Thermoanaerobaculia bacterium]